MGRRRPASSGPSQASRASPVRASPASPTARTRTSSPSTTQERPAGAVDRGRVDRPRQPVTLDLGDGDRAGSPPGSGSPGTGVTGVTSPTSIRSSAAPAGGSGQRDPRGPPSADGGTDDRADHLTVGEQRQRAGHGVARRRRPGPPAGRAPRSGRAASMVSVWPSCGPKADCQAVVGITVEGARRTRAEVAGEVRGRRHDGARRARCRASRRAPRPERSGRRGACRPARTTALGGQVEHAAQRPLLVLAATSPGLVAEAGEHEVERWPSPVVGLRDEAGRHPHPLLHHARRRGPPRPGRPRWRGPGRTVGWTRR